MNPAALPAHMTKIVVTIGPASESPDVLERLIRAVLTIARLNFSHGDFSCHAEVIRRIQAVAKDTGRRVTIMADLPRPKPFLLGLPQPVEMTGRNLLVRCRKDKE